MATLAAIAAELTNITKKIRPIDSYVGFYGGYTLFWARFVARVASVAVHLHF